MANGIPTPQKQTEVPKKQLSQTEKTVLLRRRLQIVRDRKKLLTEQARVAATGFKRGERSAIGNIFERPAATTREAIRGQPALALTGPFAGSIALSGIAGEEAKKRALSGAMIPEEVETFQSQAIGAVQDPFARSLMRSQEITRDLIGGQLGDFLGPSGKGGQIQTTLSLAAVGMPASAAGMALDIFTNPADVLTMILPFAPGIKQQLKGVGASRFGQTLKRIGDAEIAPRKAFKRSADMFKRAFVEDNAIPRMLELMKARVNQWNPNVRAFASDVVGMPKKMVNWIGRRKPATVRANMTALNNSFDDVATSRQIKMLGKLDEAKSLYDEAFAGFDDVIPMSKTHREAGAVLKKHGLIDETGVRTALANEPTFQNSALDDVLNFYEDFKVGPTGRYGKITNRYQAPGTNKVVWQDIKNKLSRAAVKDGNMTHDVVRVTNAMHNEAQAAGLRIKPARDAYRTWAEKSSELMKRTSKGKLSQVFESQDVDDALRSLDAYLGTNYRDNVRDIAAGRKLVKDIDSLYTNAPKSTTNPTRSAMRQVADTPAKTKTIKTEFIDRIIGDDPVSNQIFRDIARFKSTQTFRNVATKIGVGIPIAIGTGAAIGGGIGLIRKLTGGGFGGGAEDVTPSG